MSVLIKYNEYTFIFNYINKKNQGNKCIGCLCQPI